MAVSKQSDRWATVPMANALKILTEGKGTVDTATVACNNFSPQANHRASMEDEMRIKPSVGRCEKSGMAEAHHEHGS